MSTRILASILARRAGGTGRHGARRRQHGAIIIMAALTLLLLLGFMGIALDFGRMFIVKTELQTALDSCALASARELDGQSDAITRAVGAGSAAGNLNGVNLQSANWSGQGQITSADISFLDKNYAATTTPASAVYSQCTHTQSNIHLWLMQAMGAFSGNTAGFPANGTVSTHAVATRVPSQTACIIPVVLPQGSYVTGQWITFDPKNGPMIWGNLDGTTDANTTNSEMRDGYCISPSPNQSITTPGTKTTVAEFWNFRFGIYKSNPSAPTGQPDYSSFIYNTSNWQGHDGAGNIGNAYQGSSPNGTPNFLAQRLAFMPCGANPAACGISTGGYQTVAQTPTLKATGANRRIVTVPIVSGSTFKNQFACMLMLDPLQPSSLVAHFEYLGLASASNSPCFTSGFAGGTIGPLVPVLVR
jgi:Flp pilus assembly protein TadG